MYNNWEELEQACMQCKKCKLWTGRTKVVIGEGNKNADLMFIGEGPGADEDRLRRTFCRKGRTINEHGISNAWN